MLRRAWPARQRAAQRHRDDRGRTAGCCGSTATSCSRRCSRRADADDRARPHHAGRGVVDVPPARAPRSSTIPRWAERVSIDGTTVVLVVSAGYPGKRRIYDRMAELGRAFVDRGRGRSLVGGARRRRRRRGLAPGADHRRCRRGRRRGRRRAARGRDPAGRCAHVLGGQRARGGAGRRRRWACPATRRRPSTPRGASSARARRPARLGLPTPRSQRVQSLDELFAAAAEIGFPAVVKPEFGASAMGCVRVDDFESLPEHLLARPRGASGPEHDVDLPRRQRPPARGVPRRRRVRRRPRDARRRVRVLSVSQNWPTAEPSFQETGLHCPPDHGAEARPPTRRAQRRRRSKRSASRAACSTSRASAPAKGPRIVEVNARMGGGRIHQIVRGGVGGRPDRGALARRPRRCPSSSRRAGSRAAPSSTDRLRACDGTPGGAPVHAS